MSNYGSPCPLKISLFSHPSIVRSTLTSPCPAEVFSIVEGTCLRDRVLSTTAAHSGPERHCLLYVLVIPRLVARARTPLIQPSATSSSSARRAFIIPDQVFYLDAAPSGPRPSLFPATVSICYPAFSAVRTKYANLTPQPPRHRPQSSAFPRCGNVRTSSIVIYDCSKHLLSLIQRCAHELRSFNPTSHLVINYAPRTRRLLSTFCGMLATFSTQLAVVELANSMYHPVFLSCIR
jgi:hypothetical protein